VTRGEHKFDIKKTSTPLSDLLVIAKVKGTKSLDVAQVAAAAEAQRAMEEAEQAEAKLTHDEWERKMARAKAEYTAKCIALEQQNEAQRAKLEAERAKDKAEQEARLAHAQEQIQDERAAWESQKEQAIRVVQHLQQQVQEQETTVASFRKYGSLFGSLPPDHVSAAAAAASSGSSHMSSVHFGSEEYVRVSHSFQASLAQMPAYKDLRFELTRIEKVNNEALSSAFYGRLKALHDAHHSTAVLEVYHGTHPRNVASILANNLQMRKSGQKDDGWFGAGLYFSKHADYTLIYNTTGEFRPVKEGDVGCVLQCSILPGASSSIAKLMDGAPCQPGFDSHVFPNGFEHVVFSSDQILPRYVLFYEVVKAPGRRFDGSIEEMGPKFDEQ
jgi:hypothetical protein